MSLVNNTNKFVVLGVGIASLVGITLFVFYRISRKSVPPPREPDPIVVVNNNKNTGTTTTTTTTTTAAERGRSNRGGDREEEDKEKEAVKAGSPTKKRQNSITKDDAASATAANTTSASSEEKLGLSQRESTLGIQAFKDGRYVGAEEHFTRALELLELQKHAQVADTNKILRNNRAAAREKLGNFAGVVEDTTKALEIDPMYRRALQRRARAYETLGNKPKCLEDLMVLSMVETATSGATGGSRQQPTLSNASPDESGGVNVHGNNSSSGGENPISSNNGGGDGSSNITGNNNNNGNSGENNNNNAAAGGGTGNEDSHGVFALIEKLTTEMGKSEASEIWKKKQQASVATLEGNLPKRSFCRGYYYSFLADELGMKAWLGRENEPSKLPALSDGLSEYSEAQGNLAYEIAQELKFKQKYLESSKYYVIAKNFAPPPVKASALLELGTLYHLCGNLALAKECFEKSLKLKTTCSILIRLGGLAIEDQDFTLGKDFFRRAFDVDDSTNSKADLHIHMSSLSLLEENLESAYTHLCEAIKFAPNFGLAHMQLGVILYRMERSVEALEQLEMACKLIPELPEVHNYKGEVFMSLERYDEALQKFNDAEAADPSSVLPLLNKGVMSATNNNNNNNNSNASPQDAIYYFDKAVESDPSCELAYVHRASYYYQLLDFDQAIENYDKAISLAKTRFDAEEYVTLRLVCMYQKIARNRLKGILE